MKVKWTEGEVNEARRMREAGMTYARIAGIIGRTKNSVRSKMIYQPSISIQAEVVCIPDHVLDERDRRLSIAPRDLTAALFGDPLPGYSALERRG